MQIQVNTDKNIEGGARLSSYIRETLESELRRFSEQITRIEVHLSDENAQKEGSDDKRCFMEARPKGLKPVVVSHNAENLDFAINGAVDKLLRSLESTLGKLRAY